MSGRLVVVATPIGNLGDLSPRAAEALRTADCVLAEDTRRTATLLRHVEADTPMQRHHLHNEARSTAEAIDRLRDGATVVLVSDAGTPLVSDPGQRLVRPRSTPASSSRRCPARPRSCTRWWWPALPAERFTFEGFLPRKGSERDERLVEIGDEQRTSVWFVAPAPCGRGHRRPRRGLRRDRPAALCRELTKLHEEVLRATLGELAATVPPSSRPAAS